MSFHSKDFHDRVSFDDLRYSEAAFEAFFKKYFQPLCVYCKFQFGFDLSEAEDLVHSAFIKLWESRQTLATDMAPRAYLYKIVDNLSRNKIKHEKVKDRYEQFVLKTTSEGSLPQTFDSVDLKQLQADIDAAITALPEQMRRIFELSRFEGLKYTEIASQLGISVKTVETQMSRALAKLREKLSGYLSFYFIVFLFSVLFKK